MPNLQATKPSVDRGFTLPDAAVADGYHWQSIVGTRPYPSTIETSDSSSTPIHLRFDEPNAIRGPSFALNWSADVGFHQPISSSVRTIAPISTLLESAVRPAKTASGEAKLANQDMVRRGPVVIRRRFYPHQWQSLVQPLLESVAQRRQVRVSWVGWDRSMPQLYLDPNHLSRAVLNLVNYAGRTSSPKDAISIRVDWQRNVSQRLIIAVEDSGCELTTELLADLNSNQAKNTQACVGGATDLGLRAAKALIIGMGGTVAAKAVHGGGTLFRLTLPLDDSASLARSWLMQNVAMASECERNEPMRVEIHAIGGQGLDAEQIDSQLQRAAARGDMVYRVARDRWLWFTLIDRATQHPPSLQWAIRQLENLTSSAESSLRTQRVYQSGLLTYRRLNGTYDGGRHLAQVTREIATRATALIGEMVPPLDDLACLHSAILASPSKRKNGLLRADSPTEGKPHLKLNAKTAAPATPDANLAHALSDLAHRWHMTQSKLRAHLAPER